MRLIVLGLLAVGLWAQTPAPGPQRGGGNDLGAVALTGTPTSGQVPVASSGTAAAWAASPGGPPTGACGGDLSGTFPNCAVHTINATDLVDAAGVSLTTGVPILAPAGSVGAPPYSFTAFPTNGVRSTAAKRLEVILGGVDELDFFHSTTPPLALVNSSTTSIGLSASGSAALTVFNNGNVSMGLNFATDFGYKLQSLKSGANGTELIFDSTATTGSTLSLLVAGQGQSGDILDIRAFNATPASGTLYFGVSSAGTVNIANSSFTFNGHTCTIVSTVVTCP